MLCLFPLLHILVCSPPSYSPSHPLHLPIITIYSPPFLLLLLFPANAVVVVTADQAKRGGKVINLKKTVDAAVQHCPSVRQVFVSRRSDAHVTMGPKDVILEDAMAVESTECVPEPMNAEDPLFILYTSGSTGKPKGIQHSSAGYLLYTSLTHKVCAH